MVKSINKLRPKFTTHADGSDAVLAGLRRLAELVE